MKKSNVTNILTAFRKMQAPLARNYTQENCPLHYCVKAPHASLCHDDIFDTVRLKPIHHSLGVVEFWVKE